MIKLNNIELAKNQEEISLASIEHMINDLSKKDSRTNGILSDISSNYALNFVNTLENIDAPLSNLNDNLIDYYRYLLFHIKKIISNPKNKMITEEVMIDKNRIKRINSKTVNWICQKPGPTVKHKLAPIKNIKSVRKIYTLNTKPNQVTKVCIEKLLDLFKSRNEMYLKFPNLFNNETLNNEIKELKKLYSFFNNVDSVIHLSPDNTILGNKHYNAIFKTYKKIKNLNFTEKSSIDFLVMMTKISIISADKVEHINELCKINDDMNFKMYINSSKEITDFKVKLVENNCILITKDMYMYDNKWDKTSTNEFKFIIENKENDLLHGQLYDVEYNDTKFEFNFNLHGLKTFLLFVLNEIGLSLKNNNEDDNFVIENVDLLSINSFDNLINNRNLTTMKYDSILKLIDTSIYDISESALENLITLNDLENNSYSNFLSNLSSKIKVNDVIIYDIRDDSDEFSSTIRNYFQSNFINSFPVWRSILAVESHKNTSIKEVVDLCGKSICVSSTDYDTNDMIYIHNGLMDSKYYISDEYEIFKKYLNSYSDKYSINIKLQIPHIISSGALSNLFNKGKDDLITFIIDGKYVSIGFDEDIFLSIIDKITIIDNGELFILPDFIFEYINVDNKVKNSDLSIGARIISDKYNNDKTKPCWYEKLADLSLEVNKNGYYDTLSLIKNEKVLNIIGKSFKFNVDETFTIPAGVSQVRLPLVRTNVYTKHSVNYDAELPSKYFPLEYPVKTKLTMTYSYNDENMYELKFEPLTEASFKELIVEWKPRVYSDKIINPVIKPKDISKEKCIELMNNEIVPFIKRLNNGLYIKGKIIENDYKKIFKYQNIFQNTRILYPEIAIQFLDIAMKYNTIENLNIILENRGNLNYESNDTKSNFIERVTGFLISLDQNSSKYFENNIDGSHKYYGRYFAFAYSNDIVSEKYKTTSSEFVVKHLSNYISSVIKNYDESVFTKRRESDFLSTFTAASMTNSKILVDIFNEDKTCARNFVDYIVLLIKKQVNDLEKILKLNDKLAKKHRDITYNINNILEISFVMLYLRDSIYFSDLMPNGKTTEIIVSSLKKINKLYYALNERVKVEIESNEKELRKKKDIKTKYIIKIDHVNDNFINVYDEIYCLILFLTGDEDVTHIKIEQSE